MARRPPPIAGPTVPPLPAATVVLTRPGPAALEVLLTRRPSTMAFAAGMMVFPGGRVDEADADPRLADRSTLGAKDARTRIGGDVAAKEALAFHCAAIRELFEEAGVLLATATDRPPTTGDVDAARAALLDGSLRLADVAERLDVRLDSAALVPIARWVTPVAYARRFDARFFAAELPAGAAPSFVGTEVAEHRWMTPTAALDAMADGALSMWIPTSATVQRLARVRTFADVSDRLAVGAAADIRTERVAADRLRVVGSSAGGAPGASVDTEIVGRRELTVIDPGDPSPEALAAILDAATTMGGSIVAIVLSSAEPEHASGADELAERTGAPVFGPPGARRVLPFPVTELAEGSLIPVGDAELRLASR